MHSRKWIFLQIFAYNTPTIRRLWSYLLYKVRKRFMSSFSLVCFGLTLVFIWIFVLGYGVFFVLLLDPRKTSNIKNGRYEILSEAPHFDLWYYLCLVSCKACSFIGIYLSLEKAMAPHSSTLAWKIPWMEEPGRLQSMGSQRVGHDWATSLSLFTFMHWRRKGQPTWMFLPGESQG